MSKPISLTAFLSKYFGGSDKVIAEKLSLDEHAVFAAEVAELNSQLEKMSLDNTTLTTSLEAAQSSVTKLTADLATAQASATTLQADLTAMTGERDKYKAQHEKHASKGDQNPSEDENSRKHTSKAGYNLNAAELFQKTRV